MQSEAWDLVAMDVDFNFDIDIPEFMRLVPKDTTILDYRVRASHPPVSRVDLTAEPVMVNKDVR